jgi:KaiC/GvpD/RAD55 family RecA-like ATPase
MVMFEKQSSDEKKGIKEMTEVTENFLDFSGDLQLVINLIGPIGSGKTVLLRNQAARLINSGHPVLYVSLNMPPERIFEEIMELTYVDRSELDNLLTIVDGYSKTVGLRSTANLSFNAANLIDFSLTLTEALRQRFEGAFIDTLSTLNIHNEEDGVLKTLQIVIAKLRTNVSRSFIAFEEGIHSEPFYHTLRFLADVNLVLKREETEKGEAVRAIHVHSANGLALDGMWHPFLIGPKGRILWRQ